MRSERMWFLVSNPWLRITKNSRPSWTIQRKRLLYPIVSPMLSHWAKVIHEMSGVNCTFARSVASWVRKFPSAIAR